MRRVVVDANVFISFFVQRNEKQRGAAKALLLSAEDGDPVVILPQFVVFEIIYVLQSSYDVSREEVATLIRDTIAFPGVVVIDDCPWKNVLEHWPDPLPSIGDAAIIAVAATNRYDSVATFDQKLIKRMKDLGVASYW